MKINEKALRNAVSRINADNDAGGYTLLLAWLLLCDGKAAVLIDRREKADSGNEVLLFDLNGRQCFGQHCERTVDESYFEATDFFERAYIGGAEAVINFDSEDMDGLIAEELRDIHSMYENEDKFVREVPIKEVRHVCSIFKLNMLFGIDTDELCDSFFLRYGVLDENGSTVQYHDVEYLPDDEQPYGCLYIDDIILDGKE